MKKIKDTLETIGLAISTFVLISSLIIFKITFVIWLINLFVDKFDNMFLSKILLYCAGAILITGIVGFLYKLKED